MNLLLGPDYEVTTLPFAMDELHPSEALEDEVRQMTSMKVVGDLLHHLGVDLALRCLHSEPHVQKKESAKREFISPVLYTAAILAGKLKNHYRRCCTCVPESNRD